MSKKFKVKLHRAITLLLAFSLAFSLAFVPDEAEAFAVDAFADGLFLVVDGFRCAAEVISGEDPESCYAAALDAGFLFIPGATN